LRHAGEKRRSCGKQFLVKSNLHHEVIHTGKKTYPCKVCNGAFSRKAYLKEHLKEHEHFHTSEYPFKCKICAETFTQKNDVKRHERKIIQM
jgi:KRAB domain-containing zinc finger protein